MNGVRKILREVFFGVAEGLIMYLIFVVAVPWFLVNAMGIQIPDEEMLNPIVTTFYLGVFIGLGVIASVLKQPVGLVFEALSSLLALAILVRFVGPGVFRETIEIGGAIMDVEFEITALLMVIVGLTLINSVMRMFERLVSMEE